MLVHNLGGGEVDCSCERDTSLTIFKEIGTIMLPKSADKDEFNTT